MVNQIIGAVLNNVTPNGTFPGGALLQTFISYAMYIAVTAAGIGLLTSIAMMAIGHHSSNGRLSDRGRTGLITSIIVGILAGAAIILINFAFGLGAKA
jgi:hypothetical protein